MAPKEKADYLVSKFVQLLEHQDHYWGVDKDAKKCATFLVDEFIAELNSLELQETGKLGEGLYDQTYWEAVKVEIETIQ